MHPVTSEVVKGSGALSISIKGPPSLCCFFSLFGKAAIPRTSSGHIESGFHSLCFLSSKCSVPRLPVQLSQVSLLHSGGMGNSRVQHGLIVHASFSPPKRKWYLSGLGFPLLPSSAHCSLGATWISCQTWMILAPCAQHPSEMSQCLVSLSSCCSFLEDRFWRPVEGKAC